MASLEELLAKLRGMGAQFGISPSSSPAAAPPLSTPGGMELGAPPPVMYGTQASPPTSLTSGNEVGQAVGQGVMNMLGGGQQQQGLPSFEEWLASMGLGDAGSSQGVSTDVPNYSAMAAQQYDPALNYLHKSIKRGKKESKKDQAMVTDMYTGLAKGDAKMANKIGREGDRSESRMKQYAKNTARSTEGNSERAIDRILKESDRLDLSASDDLATHDARRDLGRNQVYNNATARSDMNELQRQNDNWENYARAQSGISRMTGASARADLQSQLQDLVFGLRGQIADTKSQSAAAQLQAQMQEDQMQQAAEQFNASQANSAQSQQLGLVDNYQGALQALVDAQSGDGSGTDSQKTPADLEGWAGVGDEYRGFLKGSGQSHGAPGRNTDQVMSWLQSKISQLQPVPYGQTPQVDILKQLQEMWAADGGYEGTQIPMSALQQVLPTLYQNVLS